jgi:hypothetical protein
MATLIPKYTQVTTSNRTIAQKFAETISVKDFGATGDGTTDDTVAIQAAINYFGSASSATGGTVYFPNGTYKITSSIYLNYNTSLVGEGYLAVISVNGNFEAIRWNASIPSYSKNITIKNIRFIGAGVSSGHTSNTAIRLDHPWGIDGLTIQNIWVNGFAGYGIQTDQQGSSLTTNCFQFSHWDSIYIYECGVGILMGEGFCGESTFSNITCQACTTYGLQFSIGPVTGNQGQHWDTYITGQCPIGIYFGAANSGPISFTNAHIEGSTTYGVQFNSSGATGISFNSSWFVNNPIAIQGDAGGIISFSNCEFTATSVANYYVYLSATSNFNITFDGYQKLTGTTPTTQLVSPDINSFRGAMIRTAATTGSIVNNYSTVLGLQTRGLMSESATVRGSNLAGLIAIANGATTSSVTFTRTETDADYNVFVQAYIAGTSGTTWTPAIMIDSKSTTGFRAVFSSAAPSAGFAISWFIVR